MVFDLFEDLDEGFVSHVFTGGQSQFDEFLRMFDGSFGRLSVKHVRKQV